MERNTFNITVEENFHGYRIDKFLQQKISDLSRTRLQRLISAGYVKINNTKIKNSSKKIQVNDKININFPEPKETSIEPSSIPLDIFSFIFPFCGFKDPHIKASYTLFAVWLLNCLDTLM